MATFPPDGAIRRRADLLTDPAQVVRALTSFTDGVRPVSSSVLSVGSRRRSSDLLGYGALARVEEHAELTRRLKRLAARERLLLLLWYAEGWPVVSIAEHLGISRIHCYRLRNRAIEALTCPTDEPDQRALSAARAKAERIENNAQDAPLGSRSRP